MSKSILRGAIEACEPRRLLASVSGVIFYDADRSGTRNGSEYGIRDSGVYADLNNNGERDEGEPTAGSDANGFYSIKVPTGPNTIAIRLLGMPVERISTPQGGAYSFKVTTDSVISNRDFGVVPSGFTTSVSGRAFVDSDNNGIFSAGDATNVGRVFADMNADGAYQAGEPTTTRNADGTFLIPKVPTDQFVHIVAAELVPGQSESIITNPLTGFPVTGLQIVYRPLAPKFSTVTGTVFSDANKDGIKNGSDAGLDDQTVYADLNMNGQRDNGEAFATTNLSGFYTLKVPLQDGKKSISVRLAGVATSQLTAPPGGAHSGKFNVVLTAGNRNFGVAPAASQTTTISGIAFEDANGNGRRDTGERSLLGYYGGGYSIYADLNRNRAFDPGEPVSENVNSSEAGYTIANVPVGVAVDLRFTPGTSPADDGLYQTSPAGFLAPPLTVTTTTAPIVGADFGFQNAGRPQGDAYFDLDGNGVVDAGEPVREGGVFWLDLDRDQRYDANEPFLPVQDHDAGYPNKFGYSLGAPFGTYAVGYSRTNAVGALADVMTSITLTAAEPIATATIAVPLNAPAVRGIAFDDSNNDGVFNPETESALNDTVYADYNNNGKLDADENWALINKFGKGDPSYYLPVIAGKSFTLRLLGSRGPTYTVAALGGTQQVAGKDFAVPAQRFSTVTGTVWSDTDKDGLRDAGEAALSGRTVFADVNMNGVRDDGEAFAVTNANGFYTLPVPLQDGKRSISVRLEGVPTSQLTAPAGGAHSGKYNVVLTAGNRNFGVAMS